MIIDCAESPEILIDKIGDLYFSICEDYAFLDHIKIIDCENGVDIVLSSDYGREFNKEAAEALVKLLNQTYKEVR